MSTYDQFNFFTKIQHYNSVFAQQSGHLDPLSSSEQQQQQQQQSGNFLPTNLTSLPSLIPTKVVIHPLVLLSVVDHFNRVSKSREGRVAGVLLGSVGKDGEVDVTNSYAVPFEEEKKDANIWYLDHGFVEEMYAMFKKVNSNELILGWYSTGPKIRQSDIQIHETFRKYVKHPVYCIIDVKPRDVGLPTKAYIAMEKIQDEKSQPEMTFVHVPSAIEALEAEDIGVEHLLRDIKDSTVSDLNTSVLARGQALSALEGRLNDISTYLDQVIKGELPINNQITYILQDIFNLLPGMQQTDTKDAFIAYNNDSMLSQYIASLVKAAISLHNLINNKIDLRDQEKEDLKMKELERELARVKKEVREKREEQEKEEKEEEQQQNEEE
mmetsp:Transcript_7674/g.28765  ORF Transcript_7674/g.28765 Transcript_7674/m.28765 type:complete len:382 (-) Transcript_7674:944-2089(-)